MAIINGNRFTKKEKIKAVVSSEVVAKIEEYCQWANIQEAACFVFAKDKDWKDHQRTNKRASKNKAAASVK